MLKNLELKKSRMLEIFFYLQFLKETITTWELKNLDYLLI